MAAKIECPKCHNKGEAVSGSIGGFEMRGQFDGKGIFKCKRCNTGLAVGPLSGWLIGKPAIIPAEQWRIMEDSWTKRFGG